MAEVVRAGESSTAAAGLYNEVSLGFLHSANSSTKADVWRAPPSEQHLPSHSHPQFGQEEDVTFDHDTALNDVNLGQRAWDDEDGQRPEIPGNSDQLRSQNGSGAMSAAAAGPLPDGTGTFAPISRSSSRPASDARSPPAGASPDSAHAAASPGLPSSIDSRPGSEAPSASTAAPVFRPVTAASDNHQGTAADSPTGTSPLSPPQQPETLPEEHLCNSMQAAGHQVSSQLASRLGQKHHQSAEERRQAAVAAVVPEGPPVTDEELEALAIKDAATGLEVPSPLQLFLAYNTSGNGKMTLAEFRVMLRDLDGLEQAPSASVDEYTLAQFRRADQDFDGVVDMDDYYYYYYMELYSKFPDYKAGTSPGADLYAIFLRYCSLGTCGRLEEMGAHQWYRLLKEAGLVDGVRLTKAEVNIAYARAKGAEQLLSDYNSPHKLPDYCTAKLFYPQFLFGLQHVAAVKKRTFQSIVADVLSTISPLPLPSGSDWVVLQGTPGQAGEYTLQETEEAVQRPRQLPHAKAAPLAYTARMQAECKVEALLRSGQRLPARKAASSTNASPASPATASSPRPGLTETQRRAWGLMAAGGSLDNSQRFGATARLGLPKSGPAGLRDPDTMYQASRLSYDDLVIGTKRVFEAYNKLRSSSSLGLDRSDMSKEQFLRCLRDAQLISTKLDGLTLTRAQQIFGTVKSAASQTINFVDFMDALRQVATFRRSSLNEVLVALVVVGGPVTRAA